MFDPNQQKVDAERERILKNLNSSFSNREEALKKANYDEKFMKIYNKYKKKFGVNSIEDMTDEQKKEMFAQVDAEHTADYEKTEKAQQVNIIKSEYGVNEVYEKEAVDQFLEDFKKSVEGLEDAEARLQEQQDEVAKLTKVEKGGYTFFINK